MPRGRAVPRRRRAPAFKIAASGPPGGAVRPSVDPGRRRRRPLYRSERRRCARGGRSWMTTLRRARPRDDPGPQCAFEVPMINVSCSSHCVSQLAALFIDVRAE